MLKNVCAFTGHRPRKFPWGYNEQDGSCAALKDALTVQIKKLIETGYTDFLSGMAEGADTWAALAVLALRKENPTLKLHCALPCEGQADKWMASARELYSSILNQADSITYVNREYSKNCMLKRNRYMVNHASCLLAIYNGEWRGGTAMTVRYAQKLGREVIVIDPLLRDITHTPSHVLHH